MHAVVSVHVPTLFSMRQIMANAMAARTLLCPTPAALKMVLLSTLIWRDGEGAASAHLEWLAALGVAWRAPARAALSALTVRTYKGEGAGADLVSTVGLREYVSFSEPFGLALLDVPGPRQADANHALARLNSLGTRDSLVQVLGPPRWQAEMPAGFTILTTESDGPGAVSAILDDLGPTPAFDRLNAYRPPGRLSIQRLGEDRRRLLVTLPYRWRRRLADGAELEAIGP